MKKNIKRITILLASILVIYLGYSYKTTAYDAARFVKTDVSASDNAVFTYATYYDANIPIGIRTAFESDNGMFYITPGFNDTSNGSWAKGGIVTGKTVISGSSPIIYISASTIDNAQAWKPGTARKVLCHEMGHYVHAKANQIKAGAYSFNSTVSFQQAYQSEIVNLQKAEISDTLKTSFSKAASLKEYYANIFAGLVTEPQGTMAAFPISSTMVSQDIALVSSYYGY